MNKLHPTCLCPQREEKCEHKNPGFALNIDGTQGVWCKDCGLKYASPQTQHDLECTGCGGVNCSKGKQNYCGSPQRQDRECEHSYNNLVPPKCMKCDYQMDGFINEDKEWNKK